MRTTSTHLTRQIFHSLIGRVEGLPLDAVREAQLADALRRLTVQIEKPGTQLFTNSLLFEVILRYASPRTIACLAMASRAAHELVQSFLPRAFDINVALRRFFSNPLDFRSLQGETGMLISGSFALQFLDRIIYEDSDLDLYCNFSDRHMIGRWLMEREGYVFEPNSLQDPSFNVAADEAPEDMDLDPYAALRGISAVFTFTKGSGGDSANARKVQLIVVYRSPMEAILNYHSTTVMNVIAYDYAYSLYPRATFEERLFLLCVRKSHRHLAAIEKYRSRGFSILHEKAARDPIAWKIFDPSLFPAMIPRWMGDGYTWRLPLSLEGVKAPLPFSESSQAPTTDPCFVTSWKHELAVKDIDLTTSAPVKVVSRIKYDVIDISAYAYQYVCAPGATLQRVMSTMLMLRDMYNVAPLNSGTAETSFLDEELFQYFKKFVQGRSAWEDWHQPGT